MTAINDDDRTILPSAGDINEHFESPTNSLEWSENFTTLTEVLQQVPNHTKVMKTIGLIQERA
ncbi:hypothetical protein M408DRAFT_157461 [Serendipita vermifera MAFF 305830]|uniref:Uncharacterized protein n=1 Tax=Serendipita vermifera MAFF 305830 TaxID=933852 RepID=A0A0C3BQ99_SERVB|nr:hypothetical protein M408DRAFT_157461 [Serendipita vermifera MAFF 305830]